MTSIRTKFEKEIANQREKEEVLQEKEINDRKNLRKKIETDLALRKKMVLFQNELDAIKRDLHSLNFRLKGRL